MLSIVLHLVVKPILHVGQHWITFNSKLWAAPATGHSHWKQIKFKLKGDVERGIGWQLIGHRQTFSLRTAVCWWLFSFPSTWILICWQLATLSVSRPSADIWQMLLWWMTMCQVISVAKSMWIRCGLGQFLVGRHLRLICCRLQILVASPWHPNLSNFGQSAGYQVNHALAVVMVGLQCPSALSNSQNGFTWQGLLCETREILLAFVPCLG